MIFSASLPGSDDFVLFDLLDVNSALFADVLYDISVLRISLIRIFGWKHSYCSVAVFQCHLSQVKSPLFI